MAFSNCECPLGLEDQSSGAELQVRFSGDTSVPHRKASVASHPPLLAVHLLLLYLADKPRPSQQALTTLPSGRCAPSPYTAPQTILSRHLQISMTAVLSLGPFFGRHVGHGERPSLLSCGFTEQEPGTQHHREQASESK